MREAVDGDDAGFGQMGLGAAEGDVAEEVEEGCDVGLAGPECQFEDGDAGELLEAVQGDLGVHPGFEEGGVARGECGEVERRGVHGGNYASEARSRVIPPFNAGVVRTRALVKCGLRTTATGGGRCGSACAVMRAFGVGGRGTNPSPALP